MKISERKQRVRARGIVPVSHTPVQQTRSSWSAGRQRVESAATGSRGTTKGRGNRPRRQMSPSMQISLGVAYIVFAPLMFVQYWSLLHTPKAKYHPGTFDVVAQLALPILFFLFGLWSIYRGTKARRAAQGSNAAAATANAGGGRVAAATTSASARSARASRAARAPRASSVVTVTAGDGRTDDTAPVAAATGLGGRLTRWLPGRSLRQPTR